jgi:hypothetical protein
MVATTTKSQIFVFSPQKAKQKEKSHVKYNHLNNHKFLVYYDVQKRFFCNYFVTFDDFCGANKNIKVEKLCTKPLITFSKQTGKDGDLQVHENLTFTATL